MKLIATKDFANVPALGLSIKDAQHPAHIHKGATFEIGKEATLGKLTKSEQELVATLIVSEVAGDASDEKLVKQINAEVEAETKKAKASVKVDDSVSNANLVATLTKLLEKAATAPAK